MPCYDARGDANTREGMEELRRTLLAEFTHNSPVAEMLCDLVRKIDKHPKCGIIISPELDVWWKEHQARDKARQKAADSVKAASDAKAKALAKPCGSQGLGDQTMTKTMEQVKIAQSYAGEKKLALALVHLNAAAVFAAVEFPQHVPAIRDTIDHYRNAYKAMSRHPPTQGFGVASQEDGI